MAEKDIEIQKLQHIIEKPEHFNFLAIRSERSLFEVLKNTLSLGSTGEPFTSFVINSNTPSSAHYNWFILQLIDEFQTTFNKQSSTTNNTTPSTASHTFHTQVSHQSSVLSNQSSSNNIQNQAAISSGIATEQERVMVKMDMLLADLFIDEQSDCKQGLDSDQLFKSLMLLRSILYKMVYLNMKGLDGLYIPPLRVHKFHTNLSFQFYNIKEIKYSLPLDAQSFQILLLTKYHGDEQLYSLLLNKLSQYFCFLNFLSSTILTDLINPESQSILNQLIKVLECQTIDSLLRITCESILSEYHGNLLKYLPFLQYCLSKGNVQVNQQVMDLLKCVHQYATQSSDSGNKFAMQKIRILNEVERIFYDIRTNTQCMQLIQLQGLGNYIGNQFHLNNDESKIKQQNSVKDYDKFQIYESLLAIDPDQKSNISILFNTKTEQNMVQDPEGRFIKYFQSCYRGGSQQIGLVNKQEIQHLIKVINQSKGNLTFNSLQQKMEFDIFNKNYIQFLLNSPGTHMLKYILEKSIGAIQKNDFRLATIYTFPYLKLRKLILFLMWDKSYDDFDKKQNILKFACDSISSSSVSSSLDQEDFNIQCLIEELQLMISLSQIIEKEILKECKVNYFKAQDIYEILSTSFEKENNNQSWIGGILKQHALTLMNKEINQNFNSKLNEVMPQINIRLRSIIQWNLKIQNGFMVIKIMWETLNEKYTKDVFKSNLQYIDQQLTELRSSTIIYLHIIEIILSLLLGSNNNKDILHCREVKQGIQILNIIINHLNQSEDPRCVQIARILTLRIQAYLSTQTPTLKNPLTHQIQLQLSDYLGMKSDEMTIYALKTQNMSLLAEIEFQTGSFLQQEFLKISNLISSDPDISLMNHDSLINYAISHCKSIMVSLDILSKQTNGKGQLTGKTLIAIQKLIVQVQQNIKESLLFETMQQALLDTKSIQHSMLGGNQSQQQSHTGIGGQNANSEIRSKQKQALINLIDSYNNKKTNDFIKSISSFIKISSESSVPKEQTQNEESKEIGKDKLKATSANTEYLLNFLQHLSRVQNLLPIHLFLQQSPYDCIVQLQGSDDNFKKILKLKNLIKTDILKILSNLPINEVKNLTSLIKKEFNESEYDFKDLIQLSLIKEKPKLLSLILQIHYIKDNSQELIELVSSQEKLAQFIQITVEEQPTVKPYVIKSSFKETAEQIGEEFNQINKPLKKPIITNAKVAGFLNNLKSSRTSSVKEEEPKVIQNINFEDLSQLKIKDLKFNQQVVPEKSLLIIKVLLKYNIIEEINTYQQSLEYLKKNFIQVLHATSKIDINDTNLLLEYLKDNNIYKEKYNDHYIQYIKTYSYLPIDSMKDLKLDQVQEIFQHLFRHKEILLAERLVSLYTDSWSQNQQHLLKLIILTTKPIENWNMNFKTANDLIQRLIQNIDLSSLHIINKQYPEIINPKDLKTFFIQNYLTQITEINNLYKLLKIKYSKEEIIEFLQTEVLTHLVSKSVKQVNQYDLLQMKKAFDYIDKKLTDKERNQTNLQQVYHYLQKQIKNYLHLCQLIAKHRIAQQKIPDITFKEFQNIFTNWTQQNSPLKNLVKFLTKQDLYEEAMTFCQQLGLYNQVKMVQYKKCKYLCKDLQYQRVIELTKKWFSFGESKNEIGQQNTSEENEDKRFYLLKLIGFLMQDEETFNEINQLKVELQYLALQYIYGVKNLPPQLFLTEDQVKYKPQLDLKTFQSNKQILFLDDEKQMIKLKTPQSIKEQKQQLKSQLSNMFYQHTI